LAIENRMREIDPVKYAATGNFKDGAVICEKGKFATGF